MSILIIIATVIFIGVSNRRPQRALNRFLNMVEQGNLHEINLTIYYIPLSSRFHIALQTSEDIKANRSATTFHVDGITLAEHADLFQRTNFDNLRRHRHKCECFHPECGGADVRIYYVFRDNRNRRIFDVTMWGAISGRCSGLSVFINGVEFHSQIAFVNILLPFLPEEEAARIKEFVNEARYFGKHD